MTTRSRLIGFSVGAVLWIGALFSPGFRAIDARAAADPPQGTEVKSPHGDLKAECEDCHTSKSWKELRSPIAFKHESTGFPLTGRHTSAPCAACHSSLVFSRVATSCADCHRDVHEGRSGTRCQDCHATQSWSSRSKTVADHARAGFPLRGVHGLVECSRCHVDLGERTRTPISRTCYACHVEAYAATQNPNHAAAGFSTRCESCHDPGQSRWGGAGFNHALTRFPLMGAHSTISCDRCHTGGQFTGAPTDCYSCHRTDYEGTLNPSHVTAGYPTSCASCHTTTAWRPANIDHDGLYFRIYSGRHKDTWASCAICHSNAASYADFTCLTCHVHNQLDMDAKHAGRTGYAYVSSACYSCHRGV